MNLPPLLDALHFLRPAWLWGIAAVPLLAWAWRRRMVARDPWHGRVDAHLLPHLLEDAPRGQLRRRGPIVLACVAVLLALVALAGPSWQRSAQPLWQVRMPLVIALDLSGGITASDLPPSRLAQARATLASLLQRRIGGDAGLLVYAEEPFVVAPLTSDPANIALFLDALSPGIMPGDGDAASRPDRGIAMAADLLRQAGYSQGDILLLEDAASADAIAAAREAAAQGYRVSVLGLGTPAGAPWRDTSGKIRHASLSAVSLRAVASAGQGAYAPLQGDGIAALGLIEPRQGSSGETHGQAQAWLDQGYWLLLPLLLLAALAFRRGGALAACLACLLLPWTPARAAGIDWWQRADQQAHARLVEGAEAYRQGRFDQALRAWDGVPGAEAAYDSGNAFARQGRYPEAIEAYDRALQLRPGMADAIANRVAVRKAQRKPPPQDGNGEQQSPASTPQSGDRPDAATKEGEDRQGAKRPQPAPPEAVPKPGEEGEAGQRPGESADEREQRMANEARLRRVPDDPGGLLRARFELEYRRRQEQGR